jgi:hypothetical protein
VIHEPPCRDWRDHLAIAVEAQDVEYHLPDFLDRFDAEREAEERAIEPADDNPWNSAYAHWAPGELQEAFGV